MSLSEAKLEFWAKNKFNVCLAGRHGVGKTGQVKSLFNRLYGELGVDWLYLSASTMDPWVDFIGVPKEKTAEDGTTYLGLVRPEVFARDQIKAIFLDEYNRAPKKIRNAVMELIQFGSINGHKFEQLQVVWTAINPPEEEEGITYDVEEVDAAQLDRFHVYVEVPYAVSKAFFIKKYGKDTGSAAVEWWNSLNKESKDLVSPRRLDYAIDCYVKGGDVRDILDKKINSSELLFVLSEGSIRQALERLKEDNDDEATIKRLQDENFFKIAIKSILKDDDFIHYFFPLMPDEKFSAYIGSATKKKMDNLLSKLPANQKVKDKIDPIIQAKSITNSKIKTLEMWIKRNFAIPTKSVSEDSATFKKNFNDLLTNLRNRQNYRFSTTYDRINNLTELTSFIIASDKCNMSKEITKVQAKKAYKELLYFIYRSQQPTYRKVSKDWNTAFGILNDVHSFMNLYPTIVKEDTSNNSNISSSSYAYDRLENWGIDLDNITYKSTIEERSIDVVISDILVDNDDAPF